MFIDQFVMAWHTKEARAQGQNTHIKAHIKALWCAPAHIFALECALGCDLFSTLCFYVRLSLLHSSIVVLLSALVCASSLCLYILVENHHQLVYYLFKMLTTLAPKSTLHKPTIILWVGFNVTKRFLKTICNLKERVKIKSQNHKLKTECKTKTRFN